MNGIFPLKNVLTQDHHELNKKKCKRGPKNNAVAIRTAPVRQLVFAIHTGVLILAYPNDYIHL